MTANPVLLLAAVCTLSLVSCGPLERDGRTAYCSSTGPGCITSATSSCQYLPDGDYQACEGCTFYHSCVNHYLDPRHTFRPCPLTNYGGLNGKLVWQQNNTAIAVGRCEYYSTTCQECYNPIQTTLVPPPPPLCRTSSTGSNCLTSAPTSCQGKPDGDYQACEGCTFYHSCVAGTLYAHNSFRPCPRADYGGQNGFLVWQQETLNSGQCLRQSTTCGTGGNGGNGCDPTRGPDQCRTTGPRCITDSVNSCQGRHDGDYQACESCNFYHSCSNGIIVPRRPCAPVHAGQPPLVWFQESEYTGRCEWTSSTCQCDGSSDGTATPPPPPVDTTTRQTGECSYTGPSCIRDSPNSCRSLPNGDYQACEGCNFFHTCSNGDIYARRPCAANHPGQPPLAWVQFNATAGYCDWSSTTCRCRDPDTITTTRQTLTTSRSQECVDGIGCIPETPDTCRDRLDGDYQSCASCNRYISCREGRTWLDRTCQIDATSGQQWSWIITSRTQGYCGPHSTTCNSCPIDVKCTTGAGCIEESPTVCRSMLDGDYQSCSDCHVYISCKGGQTWDRRPCPRDESTGTLTTWKITSPTQGYCTLNSNTCNECPYEPEPPHIPGCRSTGTNCITAAADSCRNRADGDYQACEGCTIYHSCSGGVIWPNRNCPLTNYGGLNGRLVWYQLGSNVGRCEYSSPTCTECVSSREVVDAEWESERELLLPLLDADQEREERQLCASTGSRCITSCIGRPDGDYQSCSKCSGYVSCVDGQMINNRPCPPGLEWDDSNSVKRCVFLSSTCLCRS